MMNEIYDNVEILEEFSRSIFIVMPKEPDSNECKYQSNWWQNKEHKDKKRWYLDKGKEVVVSYDQPCLERI